MPILHREKDTAQRIADQQSHKPDDNDQARAVFGSLYGADPIFVAVQKSRGSAAGRGSQRTGGAQDQHHGDSDMV